MLDPLPLTQEKRKHDAYGDDARGGHRGWKEERSLEEQTKDLLLGSKE